MQKAALESFDEQIVQNRNYPPRNLWQLMNQRQRHKGEISKKIETWVVKYRKVLRWIKLKGISTKLKIERIPKLCGNWIWKAHAQIQSFCLRNNVDLSAPPDYSGETNFALPYLLLDASQGRQLERTILKRLIDKAPGPAGTSTEFFKWLDDHTKGRFMQCLNVVGQNSNPRLFQPATSMLHYFTTKMRTTSQRYWWWFVPQRSAANLCLCFRRLADFAEQDNDPLYSIFQAWETRSTNLIMKLCSSSLRDSRFHLVFLIRTSFYSNPILHVLEPDHENDLQKQRIGLRQGCPQSPYFF